MGTATEQLRSVATGDKPKPTSFPGMLEAYKGEIARALPKHLNADNMARIALTCFRMNPKLAQCEAASVFACVIQASQLGLRPGLMGECFLIPFEERRKNRTVCTLQLGYQGMLELARRSGLVLSLGAYIVHGKDTWTVRFGTEPGITHVPHLDGDPGAAKLGYAVAQLRGGGMHAEVMSIAEINRHRDRSQNYRAAKAGGWLTPWDTDYEEMARKTVIRRICKYLPKSNELAIGMALDDAAAAGVQALSVEDAISNVWVPEVIDVEPSESGGPAAGASSEKASP